MKSFLKRFTAALAAAALIFTLCSCGKNTEPKKETPENTVSDTNLQKGYESEKYNLKFTPPEGYVMFTDSQKAAQMAGSKNTSCEMISEHSDGFPQIKVVFEKFDGDEAAYLENMKKSFEANSINASYTDPSETEIAGAKYYGFTISVEDSINMEVYSKKFGDGILCISVTSLAGSDTGSVLDAFSKMK